MQTDIDEYHFENQEGENKKGSRATRNAHNREGDTPLGLVQKKVKKRK